LVEIGGNNEINLYFPSTALRLPLAPASAGANKRVLMGFHGAAPTLYIQVGFSILADLLNGR